MVFSEQHQPFYFHEFVHMIDEADLQFLGDSDATRLFGPREPPAVRAFLDGLPRFDQQQYLDFLTNCAHRSAMVCHSDAEIRSDPDEGVLRESGSAWRLLLLESWLRPIRNSRKSLFASGRGDPNMLPSAT
jgi:hypothetical protein